MEHSLHSNAESLELSIGSLQTSDPALKNPELSVTVVVTLCFLNAMMSWNIVQCMMS